MKERGVQGDCLRRDDTRRLHAHSFLIFWSNKRNTLLSQTVMSHYTTNVIKDDKI